MFHKGSTWSWKRIAFSTNSEVMASYHFLITSSCWLFYRVSMIEAFLFHSIKVSFFSILCNGNEFILFFRVILTVFQFSNQNQKAFNIFVYDSRSIANCDNDLVLHFMCGNQVVMTTLLTRLAFAPVCRLLLLHCCIDNSTFWIKKIFFPKRLKLYLLSFISLYNFK